MSLLLGLTLPFIGAMLILVFGNPKASLGKFLRENPKPWCNTTPPNWPPPYLERIARGIGHCVIFQAASDYDTSIREIKGFACATAVDIGFPFHFLRWEESTYETLSHKTIVDSSLRTSGIRCPRLTGYTLSRLFTLERRIPLNLSPSGYILNSACYTLALWTAATLFFHLAAKTRHRRGHCPTCGYDLAGLATTNLCPECGSLTRHKFFVRPNVDERQSEHVHPPL